jgi:hypothetical protein
MIISQPARVNPAACHLISIVNISARDRLEMCQQISMLRLSSRVVAYIGSCGTKVPARVSNNTSVRRPLKAKYLVSASVNSASHESLSGLPQSLRFAKFGHIRDPEHLSRTSKAASRRGQPSQSAGLLNNGHASELGKSQMAVQIKDGSSFSAITTTSIQQASQFPLNIQDRAPTASNTDGNNSDSIRVVQEHIGSGCSTRRLQQEDLCDVDHNLFLLWDN